MDRKLKKSKKSKAEFSFKKFLGELVSFGSPQAIVINIFLIFLLLTIIPTIVFEHHHDYCIFKKFIIPLFFPDGCPTEGVFENCECPGCGMTRAFSSIMHGKINDAIDYNRGIFALIPAMLIVFVINSRKWYHFYKKTKKIFN